MKIRTNRQIMAVLAAAFGCMIGTLVMAGEPGKKAHPALSEQEMLQDCAECHQQATPALEKQWFASRHGLAMVKCYQCHGTFENFAVTPPRDSCAACHTDMLSKCAADKACWQCHVPHQFTVKK